MADPDANPPIDADGGDPGPAPIGQNEDDLVDIDPYDDGTGGIPEYDWNSAPKNVLATRRQLRAKGLRPGGQDPAAQLRCRHCSYRPLTKCRHMAWLYRIDLALPVRPMTLAKEVALDRAMEARQRCPQCTRRYFHCLPLKKFGTCLECHDGTPADPNSYTTPRCPGDLAA